MHLLQWEYMKSRYWVIISVLLVGSILRFSAINKHIPQRTEQISPTEPSVVSPELPITSETPIATKKTVTTQITPSPTPTPLKITQPNPTKSQKGAITQLTYQKIETGTYTKIDISEYTPQNIVVSWPKGTQLRWTQDINPTSLQLVPIDDEEEPGDKLNFSGLLATPNSKSFYVYAEEETKNVVISLLPSTDAVTDNFSVQAVSTGIYNSDSGASYSAQPIVTRDDWGANPASWDNTSSANIDSAARFVWNPVYYGVTRLVVHHTATVPNASNPAASVRAIYLYHSYIRGWGDIGYNFLIDQNGTIYQGKLGGDGTQGYHAFGAANRISVGISLIGDFTTTVPPPKQRAALIKLLAEKAAFYGFSLKYSDGGTAKWRDSSYTVFGHRTAYIWNSGLSRWDSEQTACPGNTFAPMLPSIVTDAENYRKSNFTGLKTLATEVSTAFAQPHDQGVIYVKYNVPDTTPSTVIESYLPKYSGITDYTIDGNLVTISLTSSTVVHPKYADSEYLIPPMGWTGYSGEYATFTPALTLNGPEDRAKILLKIFRLDPRVAAADVKHYLSTQE